MVLIQWSILCTLCGLLLAKEIQDLVFSTSSFENYAHSINKSLTSLLSRPFFRYFKINLSRPCPFWKEAQVCTNRECTLNVSSQAPKGWESRLSDISFPVFQLGSHLAGLTEEDDEFCLIDREWENGVFVDLVENPERFTGYSGPAATKIWNAIYNENCFVESSKSKRTLTDHSDNWNDCIEGRIFYRAISGLHASISIHLADQYFDESKSLWTRSHEIYWQRVGSYPDRVQNVYFVHAILTKSIRELAKKLGDLEFSKDQSEDSFIKELIHEISTKTQLSDEEMQSLNLASYRLHEEFREHYKNVTRIMDCISCERCRLWGKIQTIGIGTALKIISLQADRTKWLLTDFRRQELVALFNTFGRFTESILTIEYFGASRPLDTPKPIFVFPTSDVIILTFVFLITLMACVFK